MAHIKNDGGGAGAIHHPDVYWATLSGPALAAECWRRWRWYQEGLQSSGRLLTLRDSADAYYGREPGGTTWASRRVRRNRLNPGVLKAKSNHYGSTARSKITLITSKPLTFNVHTTNTDATSQSDAQAGTALLEYVKREYNLERIRRIQARHGVIYMAGWVTWDWDKSAGDEMDPNAVPPGELEYELDDDGEPVLDENDQPILASLPFYGRLVLRNHTPVDAAFDSFAPNPNPRWGIFRHWENRYDLAERHKKYRNEILSFTPEYREEWRLSSQYEALKTQAHSDLIPVYRFIHDRTPALPDGREAFFLSDSIALSAGPLEYGLFPARRFCPEDTDDSPDGYSPLTDTLNLQEAHDAALSMALSKQMATMPKVVVSMQANIAKKDLGGGFQVYTVNGNPSDVMSFQEYDSSAEKDINLASYLQEQIETGTGINSVLRGNPNEALKADSGRAYAFIQAQAAINTYGEEGNLRECWAYVAMGIIDTFRRHHRAQQQLMVIAGKAKESQALTFLGERDLKSVRAVTVEQGDALTSTVAGRLEMMGLFKDLGIEGLDFNKIYQIVTEGRWDGALEDAVNIDLHVRTENERMVEGQQIVPLESENHLKHIMGHFALANRPGVNPRVAANALQHIRYHIYQWRIADPGMLAALGLPPLPPDPLFGGAAVDPATGAPMDPGLLGQGAAGAAPAGPGGAPAEEQPAPEDGSALTQEQEPGQPTAEDEDPGLPTLPNGQTADPTNQGTPPFPEV